MKLPAEAASLLLRHLLEQCLVGVAASAVEKDDLSRGGGSFRLPRNNNGATNVYHPTCRVRAVPKLAAKLSDQGELQRPFPV